MERSKFQDKLHEFMVNCGIASIFPEDSYSCEDGCCSSYAAIIVRFNDGSELTFDRL